MPSLFLVNISLGSWTEHDRI